MLVSVAVAYWTGVATLGCSAWFNVLPAWAMRCVGWAAARGKPTQAQALPPRPPWRWTVPHAWFWHFYALGSAWTLALLLLRPSPHIARRPPLLELLLLAHTLRRLGESVWFATLRSSARMSVPAYAFGLSYYIMAPLTLALVDGAELVDSCRASSPPWVTMLLRTAGTGVFLYGSYHQHMCHRTLGRLRASTATGGKGSTRDYGVPRGGWFERISCAHYTAEVVLYAGVACVGAGACLPACATGVLPWLLLAAVTGNLGFSARATHAWYLQHLPNYPRERWAFIPWVC